MNGSSIIQNNDILGTPKMPYISNDIPPDSENGYLIGKRSTIFPSQRGAFDKPKKSHFEESSQEKLPSVRTSNTNTFSALTTE